MAIAHFAKSPILLSDWSDWPVGRSSGLQKAWSEPTASRLSRGAGRAPNTAGFGGPLHAGLDLGWGVAFGLAAEAVDSLLASGAQALRDPSMGDFAEPQT